MNPLTKTGRLPQAIESVVKANDSLLMKLVFDSLAGRYCAHCQSYYFHFREDEFGNSFLDTDVYALEGCVMWEARLHRHFWARVKSGELGVSAKVLFRLPEAGPQQTPQKLVSVSPPGQPSGAAPVQNNV